MLNFLFFWIYFLGSLLLFDLAFHIPFVKKRIDRLLTKIERREL